jgi:hypothetical protein
MLKVTGIIAVTGVKNGVKVTGKIVGFIAERIFL